MVWYNTVTVFPPHHQYALYFLCNTQYDYSYSHALSLYLSHARSYPHARTLRPPSLFIKALYIMTNYHDDLKVASDKTGHGTTVPADLATED